MIDGDTTSRAGFSPAEFGEILGSSRVFELQVDWDTKGTGLRPEMAIRISAWRAPFYDVVRHPPPGWEEACPEASWVSGTVDAEIQLSSEERTPIVWHMTGSATMESAALEPMWMEFDEQFTTEEAPPGWLEVWQRLLPRATITGISVGVTGAPAASEGFVGASAWAENEENSWVSSLMGEW